MKESLFILFCFISISMYGQNTAKNDSTIIISTKDHTLFSKKDDGIHAIRYIFGKGTQNKSSYLKFGERILYSTSFVWIPTRGYYKEHWHHECTWYNRISFNINKSIYVGLHYLMIFTKGSVIYDEAPSETFGIYGLVFQYDFLPRFDNRLYIETSLNKGNYCTCEDDDPYKLADLTYVGFGFGYDFPIYRRVSFSVGFTNYLILDNVKEKTNFTQYVLGLNINLGKDTYRTNFRFLELFN